MMARSRIPLQSYGFLPGMCVGLPFKKQIEHELTSPPTDLFGMRSVLGMLSRARQRYSRSKESIFSDNVLDK